MAISVGLNQFDVQMLVSHTPHPLLYKTFIHLHSAVAVRQNGVSSNVCVRPECHQTIVIMPFLCLMVLQFKFFTLLRHTSAC